MQNDSIVAVTEQIDAEFGRNYTYKTSVSIVDNKPILTFRDLVCFSLIFYLIYRRLMAIDFI